MHKNENIELVNVPPKVPKPIVDEEKYVEIQIPEAEFDELTEIAKNLGFKSIDEFVGTAVRARLLHLKREVGDK